MVWAVNSEEENFPNSTPSPISWHLKQDSSEESIICVRHSFVSLLPRYRSWNMSVKQTCLILWNQL